MTIRLARFGDHWRRALARSYSCRYEELRYGGLRCLHDGSIDFSPGITAVVGGNGVGKSTLAHAAVEVLAGARGIPYLTDRGGRIYGAALEARLCTSGSPKMVGLEISADGLKRQFGDETLVQWLDPSGLATECQRQILGDPAFSDLLEGSGAKALSAEELELASYVVGKEYDACDVWEIEGYGQFNTLPYFRVSAGGVAYGSEVMGSGELSLLLALWALIVVPRDSILVLEEPETHVSPRSQEALMNVVAWACDTRGLWIVLTTHSPVVLQRLPTSHVRLLYSDGGKSRLVARPNRRQIAMVLGGGVAYRSILLVEDEAAKLLVEAALESVSPDLRYQVLVVVAEGGRSRIAGALTQLPKNEAVFLVGAFDGDERERLKPDGFCWPHVFLPGASPPEQMLRIALHSDEAVDAFASSLRRQRSDVTVALSTVAGRDHHDWLNELCAALGPDKPTVVRALAAAWLTANRTLAETFASDLEAALAR